MMTNETVSLRVECPECSGTGLYRGFMEAKGEAVICVRCDGTGCAEYRYKPFVKRKERKGVKTVRRSRGSFIVTGVGFMGKEITYKEFKEGKMP